MQNGLVTCTSHKPSSSRDGARILVLNLLVAARTTWSTLREERGQTIVECGAVMAVITLGIVAALGLLSGGIGHAISGIASNLPGS